MSLAGEIVIDGILAAKPELAAQVRYTADTGETTALIGAVEAALCTGLDHVRMTTEQGLYNGADGLVRYKASNEPAAWALNDAICGQVIELKLYGATTWLRVRVTGRRAMAGGVRLNVSAEFAER